MKTFEVVQAFVKQGHMAKLAGNSVAVFFAYVAHADADGLAWPSLETLCQKTGIASPQNVCVARRALLDAGHLTMVRRTKTSTVYRVTLLTGSVESQTVQKVDSPKTGPSEKRTVHKSDCPLSRLQIVQFSDEQQSIFRTEKRDIEEGQEEKNPIHPPAARADVTSPNRDTSAVESPEDERHHVPPALKRASRSSLPADDPPGFVRFWAEFPARRKHGRADCRRIWDRGKLEAIAEQVLAGVVRWKASDDWAREDGRFIPAPKPFLNQQKWEAEPPPARPGASRHDQRKPQRLTAEERGEYAEPDEPLPIIHG